MHEKELRETLKNVIHDVNPSSALVLDNEGELYSAGTGTLIELASRLFLITAGHVIKNRPVHTIRLYIFCYRDYIPFRVLNWGADDSKQVDIAYLELDKNQFAPYCRDEPYDPPYEIYRKPINCTKIAREIDTQRGVFLFGYPKDWKEYITANAEEGYPLVQPILQCSKIMQGTNDLLQLEYALDEQHWDCDGQPIELPHPCGMSGGSVWQFWQTQNGNYGQKTQELRLAATITCFSELERDYIIATPINYTINFIMDRHPELEPAVFSSLPPL